MAPVRIASSSHNNINNGAVQEKPKVHLQGLKRKAITGSELPGVQKLKSDIRQTRRLLAKENLSADVRVKTERRLKSLEADLEDAESKRKERTLATRYHKVKFFERKKVLRKIKQVKKELKAASENKSASSKEAATQLENALFELRVDLNYILHYPKLEKYISLFPSTDPARESRNYDVGENDASSSSINETDSRRAQLRAFIRSQMEANEFGGEPELDAEPRSKGESVGHTRSTTSQNSSFLSGISQNDLVVDGSPKKSPKSVKEQKRTNQGKTRLKESKEMKTDDTVIDDFFATGSDED